MRYPGSALMAATLGVVVGVGVAEANAPGKSLRPTIRPVALQVSESGNAAFHRWIEGYRDRALAAGIRADVFDRAMADLRYNTSVIQKDRNQSEFTKTVWEYLDSATSDLRVKNGQAALTKQRGELEEIEARYGVDKQIVVAIWGLESAYGTFRGSIPIIEAMATLAHDGRRGAFFEDQLTAALSILQSGDVTAAQMKGSWAGAMGHTQFMPTSFLQHAVDFTGDGKRDIWGDDPRDALASTAAYLKANGWTKGQPWGVEVQLPKGFDYAEANRDNMKMPSEWARLGVVDMDGRAVSNHGKASVLLPAGANGAAFLIFDNFKVLESYNTADAYVIGVGHLGDRILGGAKIRGEWPREDRALTYDERIELQERLTGQGFDTKKIDGKIGPLTIEAVRQFQKANGMKPDGYASLHILKKLR
ncbi:lytic murein transglycosylase [Shimia sp. W99]